MEELGHSKLKQSVLLSGLRVAHARGDVGAVQELAQALEALDVAPLAALDEAADYADDISAPKQLGASNGALVPEPKANGAIKSVAHPSPAAGSGHGPGVTLGNGAANPTAEVADTPDVCVKAAPKAASVPTPAPSSALKPASKPARTTASTGAPSTRKSAAPGKAKQSDEAAKQSHINLLDHVTDVSTIDDGLRLLLQGNLHVNEGKYKAAVPVYTQLIDIFAPHLSADGVMRHHGLALRWIPLSWKQWGDAAVRSLLVDAYVGRGSAYAMDRQFDKALSDFTAAIAINPRHTDSYKRRAEVYMAMGRQHLALADIQTVEQCDPGNAMQFRHRADVALRDKHYKR